MNSKLLYLGSWLSMDRANACGALGRGFKSLRARSVYLSSFFPDFDLSHICILPLSKNEPTITVTTPTTANIIPLPTAPNFVIVWLLRFLLRTFGSRLLPTAKNIAIWVAILGGGIGFFLFYGVAVEIMRWYLNLITTKKDSFYDNNIRRNQKFC